MLLVWYRHLYYPLLCSNLFIPFVYSSPTHFVKKNNHGYRERIHILHRKNGIKIHFSYQMSQNVTFVFLQKTQNKNTRHAYGVHYVKNKLLRGKSNTRAITH